MNVCYKCTLRIKHPFHDNGTINNKDIWLWETGEYAFNVRHDSGRRDE